MLLIIWLWCSYRLQIKTMASRSQWLTLHDCQHGRRWAAQDEFNGWYSHCCQSLRIVLLYVILGWLARKNKLEDSISSTEIIKELNSWARILVCWGVWMIVIKRWGKWLKIQHCGWRRNRNNQPTQLHQLPIQTQ